MAALSDRQTIVRLRGSVGTLNPSQVWLIDEGQCAADTRSPFIVPRGSSWIPLELNFQEQPIPRQHEYD